MILTRFVLFQPKGADRKHKTDREKMEKRTGAEKVGGYTLWMLSIYHFYPLSACVYFGIKNVENLENLITGDLAIW